MQLKRQGTQWRSPFSNLSGAVLDREGPDREEVPKEAGTSSAQHREETAAPVTTHQHTPMQRPRRVSILGWRSGQTAAKSLHLSAESPSPSLSASLSMCLCLCASPSLYLSLCLCVCVSVSMCSAMFLATCVSHCVAHCVCVCLCLCFCLRFSVSLLFFLFSFLSPSVQPKKAETA